jgi:molybdenum cofactor cytidylyltransferase
MGSVGAIVLAAGNSRRLGKPKQLLEFNGQTLVHSAVRAAVGGGCEIVCVVTGAERESVESAVSDLHPVLVHNDEWERGIGSSIRSGVQRLRDCSALVLLTCDQPALDSRIVRALICTHEKTGRPIAASHYAETLGVPALFSCDCFEELLRLPDDHGAKTLIAADPNRVAEIEFADGDLDIDTLKDLQTWRSRRSMKDMGHLRTGAN